MSSMCIEICKEFWTKLNYYYTIIILLLLYHLLLINIIIINIIINVSYLIESIINIYLHIYSLKDILPQNTYNMFLMHFVWCISFILLCM